MDQRTYKLRDFAQDVSVAVKDAQSHHLDKFVGLEHYDSGEPVITRYTDTSLITSSVKEFHKNDILIARRNVYLKRAGIAFFDGLTSGDSIILRIFDDSDKRTGIPKEDAVRIIPFVLNSNDFWAYANKHADGMNSKRISKEMLYDYEFSLPSLSEIRQLYSKLWAAYSLKDSYKKLLSATDEMVKSQFIEMFKDCTLIRLGDYISTQSGGTPNTKKSEYYDEGTIPWLSSGEVNQGYISSTEKYITEDGLANSAAKWVPENSVVIAMYGATAGKVGFITIPLTTNQAVCALLPNDAFDPLYLYYAVSSKKDWMIAQCRGAAQPNISQGIIRSMEIPMPSLDEQMQFANIIKQADKSKFELRKSIDAIDAVIKSLING